MLLSIIETSNFVGPTLRGIEDNGFAKSSDKKETY